MKVCWAGALTALSAALVATTAYSAHSEAAPATVRANSSADSVIWQQVTPSTSFRRSTRSANVPPGNVTSTSGRNVARPIPPTAAVDRVKLYAWSVIANVVIADPVRDSMVPSQSRRKAGISRSGETSVSRRTTSL